MLDLQPDRNAVGSDRIRSSIYELRRQIAHPRFKAPTGDGTLTMIEPLLRAIDDNTALLNARLLCHQLLRLAAALVAGSDVHRLDAASTQQILQHVQRLGQSFEHMAA